MRRVHLPALRPGPIAADPAQARHLRTVLRLAVGETVEAFDDAGRTATAVVTALEPAVTLDVGDVAVAPAGIAITVASAVPKGERADWMIEKLSEIGVARFVPLRTARSVVHPEGHKLARWRRIAVEAAKQSRRSGVLAIDGLTDLHRFVPTLDTAPSVFFSTRPNAVPLRSRIANRESRILLIGPEGGWTDEEESAFAAAGLTAAGLGPTILRVETAAVLAAGIAMLMRPDA